MTYPSAPNFASSATDSAWWLYHNARTVAANGAPLPNHPTDVCSTTGSSVVRAAKSTLNMAPSSVWSDQFHQALISKANSTLVEIAHETWAAPWTAAIRQTLLQLRLDASARTVSVAAMRWAIYVAYYAPSGLNFLDVEVPSNAVLPSWGNTIPGDPDSLYCAEIDRDPSVSALSQADRVVVATESTSGVRLRPGDFGYQGAPVTFSPQSLGGGSGNIWLGVAAVALFGVLIAKSNA